MPSFTHTNLPSRIIFGSGSKAVLLDEVRRLGCERVLVLATPQQAADADLLAAELGALAGGVFAGAVMHTPVEVTTRAMAAFAKAGADGIVSIGGGTTIGLGKAISYRNDANHIVVATTYAGSEVTPILGQTEAGIKTTIRDMRILPETVIYDPDLTLGLPVQMSVVSGLNAMAHAVGGLYSPERNPVSSLIAVQGFRALHSALPRIVCTPADVAARHDALYGSWLCGVVLGTVGMSLHHKLCHVLGGSFDLPHAEVHSVILPYATAYNARAAATELRPLEEFLGADLAAGLKVFAASLGAPQSLASIGMAEQDLDRAAVFAMRNPYANPQPLEREAIAELIKRAWHGSPPEAAQP